MVQSPSGLIWPLRDHKLPSILYGVYVDPDSTSMLKIRHVLYGTVMDKKGLNILSFNDKNACPKLLIFEVHKYRPNRLTTGT